MSKTSIEYLNNTFKQSFDTYKDSREKANKIWEYFHNRHYTNAQLAELKNLGRPPETFNIIKLFTRQLMGYYSKAITQVRLVPRQYEDITTVSVLNDVYSWVNYSNHFKQEFNRIKLDGFLSGLFVEYINVVEQKDNNGKIKKDIFGRKLYKITKEYVPSNEILLDPLSKSIDYSDARYIHRFKWIDKDELKRLFPNKRIDVNKLTLNGMEHYQETSLQFSTNNYYDEFQVDKQNHILLIHTIIRDENKTYSIYWSNDVIIDKKEITYKEVKFPYNVVKLIPSNKSEYYGVFNDVYESQNTINQALLQIQYMVNTNKVLVEENAVEDLEEFTKAYKRISAIIPVNYLAGIRVDKLDADIAKLYITIDKALDRIKQVLGINDSFLGMAFASDSGRKVELQKQATIIGLQYIDDAIMFFNRLDAEITTRLIKQYFRANQILLITDERTGDRWIEINKPLINPNTGKPFYDIAIDPETNKELTDPLGNYIMIPYNDPDTDISFTEYDVIVSDVNYNDDEADKYLIETVVNGNAGQMLMTVNPSGYARLVAMQLKEMKTRSSNDIAMIFEETAQMLAPQPQQQTQLGMGGNVGGANNGQGRGVNYLVGENNIQKSKKGNL